MGIQDWIEIGALVISCIVNVVQRVQNAKQKKLAEAVIKGVESFAPESGAEVKQSVKLEAEILGVESALNKLVKLFTEGEK